MNRSNPLSLPALREPGAAAAFRAFGEVLEAHRDRVQQALLDVALRIPVFVALLSQLDPEERALDEVESRRAEAAALMEGEWEQYLERLTMQGARYARMGVRLGGWFALLTSYRSVIHDHALTQEPERASMILDGMGRFLDVAMSTLGGAYVTEKEELARKAESMLGLYVEVFQNATLGALIYEWAAPPDPGSFRLMAANPASGLVGRPALLEDVGRTLAEARPELLLTELPGHLVATLQTREPRQWRVVADGRVFDSRCFPLNDRCVGVVFEDVTHREGVARALEQHARELERSNRELDDFAYVASHDLKAPLRDVDNLSVWIMQDAAAHLPEPSRRHLQMLRERIARMERLLDDLLAYSRAGRSEQEPEVFSVREAIDEAIDLAGPTDAFEVVVEGDAPQISAPRVPFAQVMRNLVANAIKHHDRGRGRIVVTVGDSDGRIEVAVADDGPGIPAHLHGRVFRMFQTLRPRDEVEGSGVGLAVVKKLVEQHGGAVAFDAREGRGATVRFTWPKSWKRRGVSDA